MGDTDLRAKRDQFLNYFVTAHVVNFTPPGSFTQAPNHSGTLTTKWGNPVMVALNPRPGSNVITTVNGAGEIRFMRNGSEFCRFQTQGLLDRPSSSFWMFDVVGIGTYTYTVEARGFSSFEFINTRLIAYEINN